MNRTDYILGKSTNSKRKESILDQIIAESPKDKQLLDSIQRTVNVPTIADINNDRAYRIAQRKK